MTDDLVKRARHNALADMPHYASVELIEALADRIEKLEAKLANASDRIQGLEELLWAAENDAKEAEAYAGELEAKLEKAVRLISEKPILATYEDDVQWQKYVIAELTGGKDE